MSGNVLKNPKGSVLIMAIIIASGIVVVGVEFSFFLTQSIRLARNTDSAVVSRYAAEGAMENGLYQIRKEGSTALRAYNGTVGVAQWTYRVDPQNPASAVDSNKFSDHIAVFQKKSLSKDDSVQMSLYTVGQNGTPQAVPQLTTMVVEWSGLDASCTVNGVTTYPAIETSIVTWAAPQGGAIDWSSAAVKKDFQQIAEDPVSHIAPKRITVDFSSNQLLTAGTPMVVRIKPFFCGLQSARISFPDPANAQATIPIPNYYLLAPIGYYRSVQQEGLAIVPSKDSLSSLFDFILFSQDQIHKTD